MYKIKEKIIKWKVNIYNSRIIKEIQEFYVVRLIYNLYLHDKTLRLHYVFTHLMSLYITLETFKYSMPQVMYT